MDLNKLIDSYREGIINLTRELIAIPSEAGLPSRGKPFGEYPYKALEYALDSARKLGFKVKNIDGYGGYAEFGEGSETLGILAHLDIVPPGKGWSFPPYEGQIHDGKIYGRGAIDNKGPAVAALYAMKVVMDSGIPINKKIRLIFGADEERGSKDMEYFFSKEPMPDFAIVPDANYPVIHAEKGILTLAFEKEFDNDETNVCSIKSIKGGTRSNVVPDECISTFSLPSDGDKILTHLNTFKEYAKYDMSADFDEKGGLVIKSRGISAHASMPENGENAIGQLIEFLSTLGLGDTQIEQFILFINDKIGMDYYGKLMGLDIEDDVSGKLTLNLGIVDIDQNRGKAVINIRYPVTYKLEDIMDKVYDAIDGIDVEVKIEGHTPPLYIPKDDPMVKKLLKIYEEQTGQKAEALAIGGGTYARSVKKGVAFGAQFPGKPEMAHEKDEYIEIEDLILNAKIYANAIIELAK